MRRHWISFLRIVRTGIVNFFRNMSLAIAAMAVMVVTLTIILISLVVSTTLSDTINQITDKIDISVYLADGIDSEKRQEFISSIEALPNVNTVTYLNKQQVLEAYKEANADNPELLQAISQTDNPLPATVRIKPHDLNKVTEIQAFLEQEDNLALQSDSPSYSGDRKEAIDKISHAAQMLQRIGIAGVVLFALVSILIIFNTIQMAIFNRRDEIGIMRLLGASPRYIRGPFVVESVLYGVVSAIISVLLIKVLFMASSTTLEATSLGLLDISSAQRFFDEQFWLLLGVQLLAGIMIGVVSSAIATRRYLKLKTSRR